MNKEKVMTPLGFGLISLVLSMTTLYYFIYNDEVYENRRFIDSFKHPIEMAAGQPKKIEALKALQKTNLEWAHYQLVASIKAQDAEIVSLYIAAGMVLKDRSVVMEQLIESPNNWLALVKRLGWDNKESLSGLFPVPRHLEALDEPFDKIEKRYAIPHDIAFKDHYLKFKKVHDAWHLEKTLELANVDRMCEGDMRCKIKNVPSIHVEYDKKKPLAPKKDLIIWQDPGLTLMSAAILLNNNEVVDYLKQKEVGADRNQMTMSDRMVVLFEVSPEGAISYPEGITVKELKLEGRQIAPQSE